MTDDWSYCRTALGEHSRTFAVPIRMLPDGLERTVTCAYLLCRAADTIEDTAAWSPSDKEGLFRALLDAIGEQNAASALLSQLDSLSGGDPSERELLQSLPRILAVFDRTAPESRVACVEWISELIRGMAIYTQRRAGSDGITCLHSVQDLDRYCFFVAGTIGRFLTEAFIFELEVASTNQRTLRAQAEHFGTALQLVNILRDITADLGRDCCFIPRTLLAEQGLSPRQLVEQQHRPAALEALAPLFDLARTRLDQAFAYVRALPPEELGVRRFCLIPIWLAVRTLQACERSSDLLVPERRVKISRGEVAALVAQCSSVAGDNAELGARYAQLVAGSS